MLGWRRRSACWPMRSGYLRRRRRRRSLLYEAEVSAETLLGGALKQVEELARFDERFIRDGAAAWRRRRRAVEDAAATLRDFAGKITASPERLVEIEDRLAGLDRLKRKYGADAWSEVIAFGVEVHGTKLADLGAPRCDRLAELEKARRSPRRSTWWRRGSCSAERVEPAALRLAKVAERQINELAMQARFKVKVISSHEEEEALARRIGWDRVECLIATNPGEPLKPLTEIASGGEMSARDAGAEGDG